MTITTEIIEIVEANACDSVASVCSVVIRVRGVRLEPD
jgi:hypothetical protein